MGLALSNEHVLDSFLLPTHMLSLCKPPQKVLEVNIFLILNRRAVYTTSPETRPHTPLSEKGESAGAMENGASCADLAEPVVRRVVRETKLLETIIEMEMVKPTLCFC